MIITDIWGRRDEEFGLLPDNYKSDIEKCVVERYTLYVLFNNMLNNDELWEDKYSSNCRRMS